MHLLGFIIRIYHDARSPERQKPVIHTTSLYSLEKTFRVTDLISPSLRPLLTSLFHTSLYEPQPPQRLRQSQPVSVVKPWSYKLPRAHKTQSHPLLDPSFTITYTKKHEQLIIIIFINCNWVISWWQWLF